MTASEIVGAADWAETARRLRAEGWWLLDLCGIDRLNLEVGHRFAIVVQLLHQEDKARRSIRIPAEGEPPTLPSVVEVWPTANFMEREAYDMFGITFEGHPDLTRILMPDEWEGFPLRKDYGVGKVKVEFVPQPFLQIEPPGQSPKGEEAGREVDHLGQGGQPERRHHDGDITTRSRGPR